MKKIKILYIEDDSAQRKGLSEQLREKGHSVTLAASGDSGIRSFRKRSFDVIICDLNMPGKSGLEVLEKVRGWNQLIPFVILSSRGTVPQAVTALKNGADHFFVKPVQIDQLVLTIDQLCEKVRLEDKLRISNETLRMVSANVPDIIYSLNMKGEFISLSPSVETQMGYRPTDLIGTSVFRVIHPEDRERVRRGFLQSAASVKTGIKTLRFRMVSKDGTIKHYEIRRKPVLESGKPVRDDGIARDVTEQVALEQRLKEYHEDMARANRSLLDAQKSLRAKNEEMERLLKELSERKEELQTVIDANPNAIVLVDRDGVIKESNRGVQDFFGLKVDDAVGSRYRDFKKQIRESFQNKKKFDRVIKQMEEAVDCVQEINAHELYERAIRVDKHKSGLLAPLCCPVFSKSEVKIGHLWIFADISHIQMADEQIHTIVNSSPIPTIISRPQDGRILYANSGLSSLVGLTPSELIGQATPDFYYDPEDRKKVLDALKKDGFLRNFETRIKKFDGSVIWMIFSLVLTRIAGEDVVLGWLYDISERKEVEERIQTRLRYEEGLAACSQILLSDSKTENVLNKALEILLETSRTNRVYIFENFEDSEDGLCLRLTHEVCAPGIPTHLDDPVLRHGIYHRRFERWRKNLSNDRPILGFVDSFPEKERTFLEPYGILSILVLPLWVEGQWFGFIAFDDMKTRREWSEEDIRLLKTAADMIDNYIERKKFEMALKENEERFRTLVEKANEIIYSLTPEGIFSYVSPNWTEILGHEVSEVEGHSFVPFVHPDDVPACLEFLRRVMEFGEKQSGIEYRVKHKNGTWRWHTSSATPIENEEGTVVSYIGVAHDITDMKNVMKALEESNKNLKETQAQLVQSEKMASLGSLVAGIAHEINTPIGAVSSMYDTLYRTMGKLKDLVGAECTDAQLKRLNTAFSIIDEANSVIRSGTERVVDIVRRLKSFARLDEAELKTVDIHEGLEDTLSLVHHEIKHMIEVKRDYGDLPHVSCFPGQLNQVFLNLLINAKQAIKGKGIIGIKTFTEKDKVFIEISDNGAGIPAQNLRKIFDPGFTTKGRGIGAGLGLSICYQIVQAHRGEIKVESELGRGTTFTVILPLDLEGLLESEKARERNG